MFSAITTGGPAAKTRSATKRSPPPKRSSAASTKRKPSTSSSASSTVRCMRSVSKSRGRWNPGRSTSTSWYGAPAASPFTTAEMRLRVVCGLSETMATLPPASAFTSVDLPTLGLPATATKPSSPHNSNESGSSSSGRRTSSFAVLGEDHPLEPELEQPLAAAAARGGGDRDRLDLAGAHPLRRCTGEGAALGADAERIRRVLDVDARDDAAVPQERRRAHLELRVGGVGGRRRPSRASSRSSWSVTRAPGTGSWSRAYR